MQDVHLVGSVIEHSLHGNLQSGAQVLLTNLKDNLHSKQTPAEHVLQLSGHALHEVMTLLVRTGSNPLMHFSHSFILSSLQLTHPLIHLTHALRVGLYTKPILQVSHKFVLEALGLQLTQFSIQAVQVLVKT